MTYHVDIQHASNMLPPVSDSAIIGWVTHTLTNRIDSGEITLRVVDEEEIETLNETYRKIKKPTNVLAFPADYPEEIELDCNLLGDIIICPAVLSRESLALNINPEAHWAHIVIHGVLHLLGYDHIKQQDADKMQPIEIELLRLLGFENPYQAEEHSVE